MDLAAENKQPSGGTGEQLSVDSSMYRQLRMDTGQSNTGRSKSMQNNIVDVFGSKGEQCSVASSGFMHTSHVKAMAPSPWKASADAKSNMSAEPQTATPSSRKASAEAPQTSHANAKAPTNAESPTTAPLPWKASADTKASMSAESQTAAPTSWKASAEALQKSILLCQANDRALTNVKFLVQVPAPRKASAESTSTSAAPQTEAAQYQKGSKQGNVSAGRGKQLKVVNGGDGRISIKSKQLIIELFRDKFLYVTWIIVLYCKEFVVQISAGFLEQVILLTLSLCQSASVPEVCLVKFDQAH